MARRNNYGFDKRVKELKQKKKREEKLERKRMKKQGAQTGSGENGETPAEGNDGLPKLDEVGNRLVLDIAAS
jgi:hypothetical protein